VEDNRIIGAMGIIRDITERRRTEDARRESEERVRALMNATTESALLLDSRGTLLDLNKIAARRFGGKMEQLMGLCIYDLMPAPVAQLRKARIDKVFRSGAPIRFEDERESMITMFTLSLMGKERSLQLPSSVGKSPSKSGPRRPCWRVRNDIGAYSRTIIQSCY
jgi:PAS domain S-box-containing protein